MMIAFWTWLWGGIGLLLATPMTVCLVVFARHVPQLESVRVLLSDEPAMEPALRYYQRLLAMDIDEAKLILRQYLTAQRSPERVYDEVLLPALNHATADFRANKVTRPEYQYVMSASRRILDDGIAPAFIEGKGAFVGAAVNARGGRTEVGKISLVGCPAQDEADETALIMLRQLLNPLRYHIEIIPAGTLTSEVAAKIVEKAPALVCIAAVSPAGIAQLRYICKRVRALGSNLKIVIGYWSGGEEIDGTRESLIAAGADQIGGSLCQTRDQITNLWPLISSSAPATLQPVAK
jgi:hypothetical protein